MYNRETSTWSGRWEAPAAHRQIIVGITKSLTLMRSPANKNMLFQKQGKGEKSFSFAVVKSLKAISCCCLKRRASKTAHPWYNQFPVLTGCFFCWQFLCTPSHAAFHGWPKCEGWRRECMTAWQHLWKIKLFSFPYLQLATNRISLSGIWNLLLQKQINEDQYHGLEHTQSERC